MPTLKGFTFKNQTETSADLYFYGDIVSDWWKLTVIKVGGKIVEEEATLYKLLDDFAAIEGYKVLVHGGGRSATKLAAQLGIESKMVNGRRITDAETLKVVTMVYGYHQ